MNARNPLGTPLSITPDIDAAPWSDLSPELMPLNIDGEPATIRRVGLLRHGTTEGRAVVLVDLVLPDGTTVIAQTTWRLWLTATRALEAGPVGSEEVQ